MDRFARILICCAALTILLTLDRAGAEAETRPQASAAKGKGETLPAGARAEEVKFGAAQARLAGTIYVPKLAAGRRAPAVLFVGGSELGGKEGIATPAPHAAFRELAAHLAGRGMASMIYESRCRTSGRCTSESTPHDLAEDTESALTYLYKRPEVDPARIILLGHGEGGFFAASTVAYQKNEKLKIAGIILVATPGRTYVKVLRDLAQRRLVESGAAEAKVNAYLADFDSLLSAISSGSADFASMKLDTSDPLLAQIHQTPAYFFHLAITDPLQIARTLEVPVLIVQGEKDARVGVADAQYLNEALARQYHEDAELKLLPEMDHWMRRETGKLSALSIDDPARPIDPALIALLDEWLAKRIKETK